MKICNVGEAARNQVVVYYKKHAKKRNLEFNLSNKLLDKLFAENCFYCGALPSNISSPKACNGSFIYNGIDRVDNNQGYIENNVVSCCHRCNWAKRDMSLNEFYNWILLVAKSIKRKE